MLKAKWSARETAFARTPLKSTCANLLQQGEITPIQRIPSPRAIYTTPWGRRGTGSVGSRSLCWASEHWRREVATLPMAETHIQNTALDCLQAIASYAAGRYRCQLRREAGTRVEMTPYRPLHIRCSQTAAKLANITKTE